MLLFYKRREIESTKEMVLMLFKQKKIQRSPKISYDLGKSLPLPSTRL